MHHHHPMDTYGFLGLPNTAAAIRWFLGLVQPRCIITTIIVSKYGLPNTEAAIRWVSRVHHHSNTSPPPHGLPIWCSLRFFLRILLLLIDPDCCSYPYPTYKGTHTLDFPG